MNMMTPTTNIARRAMKGNARYKTAIIFHFLASGAQILPDVVVLGVIARKQCTQPDVCQAVIRKLDAFSALAFECIRVVRCRPKLHKNY